MTEHIVHRLETVLEEMSAHLRLADESRWADALDSIHDTIRAQQIPSVLREEAREIKSLYGGMGSLNDVVLYENGLVSSRNPRFDALRRQLFDLAVQVITSDSEDLT